MTRVSWEAVGERYYDIGVDRGVLYVGAAPGVAWSGLISVNEKPNGGEPRPYYQDGIKYANLSSKEEFAASINAFAAPPEFAPCDGLVTLHNGLLATHQPRKQFNLSYRTMVGNDVDGKSHAYKIHLVYNALAGPSERNNASIGADVEPNSLTWEITTMPPVFSGFRPTAHFVIDSRYTDLSILQALEDILYGTAAANARIPSVAELVAIFA